MNTVIDEYIEYKLFAYEDIDDFNSHFSLTDDLFIDELKNGNNIGFYYRAKFIPKTVSRLTGNIKIRKEINGIPVASLLYCCYELSGTDNFIDLSGNDFSNIIFGSYAFYGLSGEIDIRGCKWGKLKYCIDMFRYMNGEIFGLDEMDMSTVVNSSGMFHNVNTKYLDISNWNVSNIRTARSMFKDAMIASGILDLSKWNMCSVEDIIFMFFNLGDIELHLDNWNEFNVKNSYATLYMCNNIYAGRLSSSKIDALWKNCGAWYKQRVYVDEVENCIDIEDEFNRIGINVILTTREFLKDIELIGNLLLDTSDNFILVIKEC